MSHRQPLISLNLPARIRGGWGIAALAATAYVAAYVLWTIFRWGSDDSITLISDLAILPLSLFAALAALSASRRVRHEPHLQRAWQFIGLSALSLFIGDAIWFVYEIILAQEPFPSIADFFYLLFYPLVLYGVLWFANRLVALKPSERWRFVIDLAIVLVSAWMVIWYFIVSPTALDSESDLLSQIIAAAYPIGDLVVIGGIVALLLRGEHIGRDTRESLSIFLSGLTLFVGADLLYAYASITDTYASGSWIDIGWFAAYLLFGFAALRQMHSAADMIDRRRWMEGIMSQMPIALPFAAIILGYGLLILVASGGFSVGAQFQGLFISGGILTLMVVGRQSITLRENVRLNNELRAFSAELEKRVVQRTLQLQNAQHALFSSQKLATVGTLAAGIVHEVSNPLNTIISAAESLQVKLTEQGTLDNETLSAYLPMISRAAWHAGKIVQALRTYSRGSAPELAPESLGNVVQDALLLMGYQLRKWDDVKLITELDNELPVVMCDRNQIAQVLINLLNNARDATPAQGTIILRVSRARNSAVIQVIDTGAGIAPEMLSKIFDPFFTTKSAGKGSGLGLSIVSSIVRAHKGTIEARSDGVGKGATFVVTLPIVPTA